MDKKNKSADSATEEIINLSCENNINTAFDRYEEMEPKKHDNFRI
jgi:hypothetical protein